MSLPAWPEADLGLGLLAGYQYQDRDPRRITEVAGGFPRVTSGAASFYRDWKHTLNLSDGQLAYFEHWLETVVDGGSQPFSKRLLTPTGLVATDVQLIKRDKALRQGLKNRIALTLRSTRMPARSTVTEDLPVWPVGLGLLRGYYYKDRVTLLTGNVKPGAQSVNRRSRFVLRDHHFTLQLSDAEQATFEQWFESDLLMGTRFFTLPLLTGAGLNDSSAQFVKLGPTRRSGLRWETTVQLLTDSRHELKLSNDQREALLSYKPRDLQVASESLAKIIDNPDWTS